MESPNKSTNQEECLKYRNDEVSNQTSKNHWVLGGTAEDALAEGHTAEMSINQTGQNQPLKMEEELKTLLQETSKLRKELESAKSEIEKLKNKSSGQKYVTQQCKIEFDLDFPNKEAKVEVMKIVFGLPDVTHITMEGKRLILKGRDIDPLALTDELKNICDAKLFRYYITEMKKEEKKEERKMEAPYPYPKPQMFADNYGAAAMRLPHFSLKEAGFIFLAVFLSLLLLRLAPYASVLIPSDA